MFMHYIIVFVKEGSKIIFKFRSVAIPGIYSSSPRGFRYLNRRAFYLLQQDII